MDPTEAIQVALERAWHDGQHGGERPGQEEAARLAQRVAPDRDGPEEEAPVGLPPARARAGRIQERMERWAGELRESLFGSPEPPASEPDRHLPPVGQLTAGEREWAADRLWEGWRQEVAAEVAPMAEYSGHDPEELVDYVLTGKPPSAPPAARVRVRTRFAPSGQPGEPYQTPPAPVKYVTIRLNEAPTWREMREIHKAISERWETPGHAEARLLDHLVNRHLTEEEAGGWAREPWERVADAWRETVGEEVGWRALATRWHRRDSRSDGSS